MTAAFTLLLTSGLLGFFAAHFFRFLPVGSAAARIAVIFILMALLGAVNLHSAFLIRKAHSMLNITDISLVYCLIYLLPALALAVALPLLLVTQGRTVGQVVSDVGTAGSAEGKYISQVVAELSHWLDLEKPASVIFSKHRNICPYAIGRGLRGGAIVLPERFYEVCLRACHNDEGLARQLLRLVLGHEIAHIRNRDVLLVPALIGTAGLFLWALALGLLASCLNAWFGFESTVKILQPRIMAVMLPGFLVLLWFVRNLITLRERAADEAAAKLMEPEVLRRLTGSPPGQAGALSPVEAFVVAVRSVRLCSHSFLGIRLTRPLDRIARFVRKQSGEQSISAFRARTRQRFEPPRPADLEMRCAADGFGAIVSSAFLGAFLFAGFQSSALQDFQSHWIEQSQTASHAKAGDGKLSGTYLRAAEQWGARLSSELGTFIPSKLGSLLVAGAMFLVCWPALAGILGNADWSPPRRLVGILGAFILLTVGFNLFLGLLEAARIPGLPEFSYLRPRKETVVLWLLLGFCGLGCLQVLGINFRHNRMPAEKPN